MNEEKDPGNLALEDEIKNILEVTDDQGDADAKVKAKSVKDVVGKKQADDVSDASDISEDENFETLESVNFDEDGNIQLDESE